jgi:glycosyltransferase involved in cell wall biosynthesis
MKEIESRNFKKCHYIIGRTTWDYRISRVLAPKSKYFHCDEILRDEFYKYTWEYKEYNKAVIFTTNSNSYYKGFQTVCQSISILNDLGIRFEWLVAGISEDDLIVDVVKKKLGKKYIANNLKLLGDLNEKEIVSYLLGSHIYVMPSHIENSPNNLCEAMILGVPCIATFAGGTGSLLQDGVEGILIQDNDPYVMSGAIIELIHDKVKCIMYGNNARKRALKRHDKDVIVNSLLNIYSEIIKIN